MNNKQWIVVLVAFLILVMLKIELRDLAVYFLGGGVAVAMFLLDEKNKPNK